MAGKLSIVATPIGNLGDITYRAIETLKDADVILAEDTRTTGTLLKHFQISPKPLLPFFEGNEDSKREDVLALLIGGKQVALVSESGTPLISDPGYKLVREVIQRGLAIESIPGPTALVSALIISGVPTNAFLFLGFLPKKEQHAKRMLLQAKDALKDIDQLKTLLFYESPHRLLKSLRLIEQLFKEHDIVVCRELTKIYEEVVRGNAEQVVQHFAKNKPRGEFVILVGQDNRP